MVAMVLLTRVVMMVLVMQGWCLQLHRWGQGLMSLVMYLYSCVNIGDAGFVSTA